MPLSLLLSQSIVLTCDFLREQLARQGNLISPAARHLVSTILNPYYVYTIVNVIIVTVKAHLFG